MIPESFIQELLNRIDIVDVVDRAVTLKKAGANFMACCPFHNEKSPSFTVSPTKQFYHCFGCGAHGTAVSFLMEYQGLSFIDAIHDLAKTVGMIVPEEKRELNIDGTEKPSIKVSPGLYELLQNAAVYYKSELKNSQRAINYLKSRGLSGQVAAKFQIGYAPDGWQNLEHLDDYRNDSLKVVGLVKENEQGRRYDRFRDRIMFPIHDQKGQIIGFGGRVIDSDSEEAKYLNSPETPLFQKGNELYGLFLARRAIKESGRVLVVEGYMDVIALAQFNIEYAVAALGTAATPAHITKLMRQTETIIFCFDGDNPGKKAAWRAAMNALPAIKDGLELKFLFLPSNHDPDSYVREFGKDKLEAEILSAMPLSHYIIHYLTQNNELNYAENSGQFWQEVKPIITKISREKAPILSLTLANKIASLLGMKVSEMMRLVKFDEEKKEPSNRTPIEYRESLSIKRDFLAMLILYPNLVVAEDANYADGKSIEDKIILSTVDFIIKNPTYKPISILEYLKLKFDNGYINQIQRDLTNFDEKIQASLVLEGFRTQFKTLMSKQKFNIISKLQEKPFSALTQEERQMLVKLTSKSN